ncbi:sulfotransferase family protein [Oharaeibacter diazotrophicus]|uniref:Sulfotransferase family protein n=1 Tax=Oharaeibacter diazotrophicus TaxID=1920512 RepID=A0A4R6RCI2_9HYPH|nr:sulfotransferase family protein [Oharaeibacter diazotrophicus]TDP83386.1 hypothetical protein EDD54_3348 [Oharaeibacter diazotrophicus]BBE72219.1 hypothetical protein OHA_1_01808 [Pleomorphomonas sp. SM30]GLS78987.1 hypothetical protein GCM10007904_43240 [Oharaeibacter diazotrophicus]
MSSPSDPRTDRSSEPAAVDRPCIVLAHPRTGSSLLMQTLALLGMPWIGRVRRDDLGEDANPRGYYEDPEVLARGLTVGEVARVGPVDGRAVKIGLANMTAPGRIGQWRAWEAGGARILVPFRHPLESAVSQRAFTPRMAEPRALFEAVTAFLYGHARDHAALASILTREVPALAERTTPIAYTRHLEDPAGFVEDVRRHAGLPADPARQAAAVANVEAALHRVEAAALPDEQREWYERSPARAVHERLCADARPWDGIAAAAAAGALRASGG